MKGTSGFLDLARLERLTHAAETLIGKARDKGSATHAQVDLILQTVDIVQDILEGLAAQGQEPKGDDSHLIRALEAAAELADNPQPSADNERTMAAKIEPVIQTSAKAIRDDHYNNAPAYQARDTNSIRVTIGTLERIMRLVSELVLTRNQLMELARKQESAAIMAPLQRLSAITTDLQDGVMQARMQPIDRLFASLPRIVRELSQDLNKKVNLSVEGADTELDRQLIETIRDPLTHIIRNCIDHGIESPEDRLAVHKPQTGVIRIIASQDAGFISIRISDDGRGIDVARVRQKALELNLADAAQLASMSNDDICRFVFAPGFSTAGTVTNVSGRGVGMDIVREHVESIGGTVALTTTAGQGTTITLKVPLPLAIVPALIFTVAGNRFAIPQDAVVEAVSSDDGESGRLKTVQGNQFFTLRDKVIPVADMRRICRLPEPTAEKYNNANSIVIISRIGTTNFAITVDELADVQEIVVKPLSSPLIHLNVFSGNTILGDGSVVLIINPVGLANAIGLDSTKQYSVNIAHDNDPNHRDVTSLILFRGNSGIHKALPLSLLSRIEEVRTQDIMESDGRLLINHMA